MHNLEVLKIRNWFSKTKQNKL